MCTNRQADAGRVGVIVPNEGSDLAHWAPCGGPLGPVRTYRPLVVPRQSEVGVRG